jgi:hypothetical protein
MTPRIRGWIVDVALGVIVGGITAAIVAVNFVIFVGLDEGYEATLGDVFRHSWAAGVVTSLILIAGPAAGVVVARRQRARRAAGAPDADGRGPGDGHPASHDA